MPGLSQTGSTLNRAGRWLHPRSAMKYQGPNSIFGDCCLDQWAPPVHWPPSCISSFLKAYGVLKPTESRNVLCHLWAGSVGQQMHSLVFLVHHCDSMDHP